MCPGIALGLLTKRYGEILVNLGDRPLVKKINGHGKRVKRNYEMAMAGVLFIHKGGDPRLLPDLLMGHLPHEDSAPIALPEPKPDQAEAADNA